MLPVSIEIEESWDLNSKTQTKFYRSRKTSWQIISFSSLIPGYDSISYLAELSGHILQDIGRCIIEKRLESWEVGAFLYDILYGPFTLLKYKAERIQSLAIHVSYSWILKMKSVSCSCFICKEFSEELHSWAISPALYILCFKSDMQGTVSQVPNSWGTVVTGFVVTFISCLLLNLKPCSELLSS